MPIAVIMPKFEMTQETGTVGTWLKAEGDIVRKGETILEIETDKVSMEVEAPADGTLAGISAGPGQVVPVGQPIAYVVRAGETWAAPPSQPQEQSPAQPASESRAEPLRQPAAASSLSQPAPAANSHQSAVAASPLAARMAIELGIDLSVVTGSGPHGQVTKRDIETHLRAAETAPFGSPEDATSTSSHASDDMAPSGEGETHSRAVPAARRLARELGVDLTKVRGTGPDGRIQSADVRIFAARIAEIAQAAADARAVDHTPAAPTDTSVLPPVGSPAVRRMLPLTSLRRTIAERMTSSVREAPQFTVAVDADMSRALAIVDDLKAGATADRPRVTLTVLLIRACAWALARHPEANSALLDGQIAEWDEVNVGVATAIDAGLIVPVVRGADRLGMRTIAAQLADLAERAREGRLKLEDLQGGTFTLSNLGMFGIDRFTAILNPPQAAILAVGRVAKRAVVTDGDRVEVRPISTLTLTADHRVLDGASAARFLATIQRALEHPGIMME
jgi:pyruvate dehydrogenase E2 component (dihydrolipoamide acetyltransferase)